MITTVRVDGSQAINSFIFSARHVRVFTRASVLEAVEHGRTVAFNLAPVDTGHYRGTFDTQFQSSGTISMGAFGTDDEKGFWLELGTHSGYDLEWHEGKPHFAPAALEAEAVLMAGLEKALNHD